MAKIVINEISSNYTYNIGSSSYATVALPITASWGPCFMKPDSKNSSSVEDMLDATTWEKFPATQAGLEAFVSTYRGPASNYRLAGDYSYQTAMTLLTAGYDVLVCRLCPGTQAKGSIFVVDAYDPEAEYNIGDIFCYYTKSQSSPNGRNVKALDAITGEINGFKTNVEYAEGSLVDYEGIVYKNTASVPTVSDFDASKLYSTNDIVKYDGSIYQCTTDMESTIPTFESNKAYAEGTIVKDNDIIYQSNTAVPSNCNDYSDTTEYSVGELCKFNGTIYQCAKSTKDQIGPFEDDKEYVVGDQVVYSDDIYKCTTATIDTISAFSDTQEYAVGDLVVQNDTIYQCTTGTRDAIGNFSDSMAYAVGALVVQNDTIYQCITAVPSNVSAYDATASYNDGDLCTYDNTIYMCTTAIVGGEAWNPDHWTTSWSKAFDANDWTTSWSRAFNQGDWTTDWHRAFDSDDWDTDWSLPFTPDVTVWNSTWSKAFDSNDWTTSLNRPFNLTEWTLNWSKPFDATQWTPVIADATDSEIATKMGQPDSNIAQFEISAKYPGTFGNSLLIKLEQKSKNLTGYPYWNLIVYVKTATNVTAVENLIFTTNSEVSAKYDILYIDEVESRFITIEPFGDYENIESGGKLEKQLSGGDDREDTSDMSISEIKASAVQYALDRYGSKPVDGYVACLEAYASDNTAEWENFLYREWLYTVATGTYNNNRQDGVYYLLTDKLTYNPDRIISPSWDDQDFTWFDKETGEVPVDFYVKSPIHDAIIKVAADSRCACGFIDIPRSLSRSQVMDADGAGGYIGKLDDVTNTEVSTHSTLWAPWGNFIYSGMGKACKASPSFMKLMIERSQIANQSLQYSWALPTNRKHDVTLGKLDYIVPKKVLDIWQKDEGVSVNVITNIPDLGTNTWGNSTLWAIPPATYNALENLSTRLLVDAVKDTAYRVGISITFQYNNQQAYSKFYAGMAPLLETMKNVGAIEGYVIKMSADINGLDSVRANSVIGKIYVTVNGVINDIFIDLIALPSSVDLNSIVL